VRGVFGTRGIRREGYLGRGVFGGAVFGERDIWREVFGEMGFGENGYTRRERG